MKPLNRSILAIEPSATLAIAARAKAMAKEGINVCSFAAGEPDYDTPQFIKDAAIDALNKGQTKYTPVAGLPDLNRAISEKFKRDNGLDYKPEQIIVSCGAKHSIALILQTLCNPGDEVIIPVPYWLSYPDMVRVAGGVPVYIEATWKENFKITPAQLEAAITDKTVAFILNSPSNPTGMVYSDGELRAFAEICVRRNITVISDEIYEKMTYDGLRHTSIASFSPEIYANTITVNGFSKTYAMPGWRLGYTGAPLHFIKAMNALQSHCASAPNTFAQFGGVTALDHGDPAVRELCVEFEKRRDRIFELVSAIPGIHCPKPQGAFYIFPNIAEFGMDSLSFAKKLLDDHHVAVVPGSAFGNDRCVRLSYACGMAEIEEGCKRFTAFCASIKK